MKNLTRGTHLTVNKPGTIFHNKTGVIVGTSELDENRILCSFPRGVFVYGFYEHDLKEAI